MYSFLLKSNPQPIYIFDVENFKFLEVNEEAVKLYGYSRDEFLQMDLTDLYAPEDIQTIIEISDSKTKEKVKSGPWKQKKKSGDSIIVEITKAIIEFESHPAAINIITNITDQIELLKTEQAYKALIKNSSDAVIVTDTSGVIITANNEAINSFSIKPDDINRKSILSLLNEKDRSRLASDLFSYPVEIEMDYELEILGSQETIFNTEVKTTPIYGELRRIENYLFVIKAKRNEGNNFSASKSGEFSLSPKFLKNLFHELLTPVNVIYGFVQDLKDSLTEMTPDQAESMEIILDNQHILHKIMDSASDYIQLESGKIPVELAETLLIDLLEPVKEQVEKSLCGDTCRIEAGKISSSLKIRTDVQKLISFISLTIINLCRYAGQSTVYLSFNYKDSGSCTIGIKNTPAGADEKIAGYFESIFRIGNEDNDAKINVKLMLKLMKILEIKYETSEKKGAGKECTFILPIELAVKEITPDYVNELPDNQKINVLKEAESSYSDNELRHKDVPPVMSDPTVKETYPQVLLSDITCLYVEDQSDSQLLFHSQFKDMKHIVIEDSFEKVIPSLRTRNYDLIILDINIKGDYNGIDALKYLRKTPGYEKKLIFASTAYILSGDREKYIKAGFTDFISKPIMRDKLLETLSKYKM